MQMATAKNPTRKGKQTIRISKMVDTRQKNYRARTQRIRDRFNQLHEGQRIRYDDVMHILSIEFCLAQRTIMSALKERD